MFHFLTLALGEGAAAGAAAASNSVWGTCLSGEGTNKDVATLKCLPNLFNLLVNSALMFAGGVALIFLLIGGIKFITSGGDPKQAGAARQTITYALLGLVIILVSFIIVNFLGYITGAECIQNFGFDTCKT